MGFFYAQNQDKKNFSKKFYPPIIQFFNHFVIEGKQQQKTEKSANVITNQIFR